MLAQSLSGLNRNTAAAPILGITLDPLGMVTPFNSGLSNPNFFEDRSARGKSVRCIFTTSISPTPDDEPIGSTNSGTHTHEQYPLR
jgi:hypothetical protein